MKLLDTLSIATTSLRRNKTRTFLTSFAVFIGVFIIIFLVSLSFGAQNVLIGQVTQQFDVKSVFVFKKDTLSTNFFTNTVEEEEDSARIMGVKALQEIREIQNVESATPLINISNRKLELSDSTFDDRVVNGATGAGWNFTENDAMVTEVLAGKYNNLQKGELVLTKDIVNAYGKSPEEFLGKKVKLSDQGGLFGSQSKPIEPEEFTVVGVINNVRNFVYIIDLDSGVEYMSKKNGYESTNEYLSVVGYQSIYVKAANERDVQEISKKIRELGFDASNLEDVLTLLNTFFALIPIIFTIIGAIAVFVAAIGIVNTMIMSVFERTREIGVMKAVGARNVHVLSLFITEAGLIGFIGGIFAVLTSLGIMALAQYVLVEKVFPAVEITGISSIFITPSWLVITTVVASTIVGILAGLYPAFRASRLDPVTALRYE